MRIRNTSLALLATGLVAVGCGSDEPTADTAAQATETAQAEPPAATDGPTITIEGFDFSVLGDVEPGTEITVENRDGAQHTLTADDGSFDTGGLDGNASATIVAPDAPGTYTFVCNIHPSMTGSFTVTG